MTKPAIKAEGISKLYRLEHGGAGSKTFRDLLSGGTHPDVVNESMTMILLARSLERMADHATNICEEVFYLVKAEDIRHRFGALKRPQ